MASFLLRKEVRTIATIDSLDIQISASFNQAAAAIQRLNSQLDSTITRLGNISREINTPIRQLNSQLNSASARLRNVGTTINASFSRVSESSRKLTEGFQKINKPVDALTNGLKRTVKQLGKVAIASVGIQKSIQNSMNYIETLNYFERAFEQVASKADLSAFSEMGYKSAEEYFNSFSERAKELTAKMSGFNVNVDGTLTASGMPSLGLDPNKLMNYQAMFGQMSSSMGVASETALKLSNALTMIGGDLASVKNMKFEKVWEDMASGLTGMSRTLDKYGVNIRNVNLQQKLNELGIKANISALNQNDKALLRGIILLDSTRYAWGDLANTLNQPANQLRLIEGNIQNLSRTIGNLLLPIIAKALPYINGFVIALQRLFTWLGKIFKIDLSNLLPKGGGGDSGTISDLLDSTGQLEDGLNAATAAAKKLNKQVRTFDELNVINTSSGGAGTGAGGIGSGLLDDAFNKAYQEYLDAWNDAFANVEDKAQGIADKIQAFFKDLFKPIAEAWKATGESVINSAKAAFESLKNAIAAIGTTFYDVFTGEIGIAWAESVFNLLRSTLDIVNAIATTFTTTWNNGAGLELVTSLFVGLTNINNLLVSIGDSFARVFNSELGERIWANILGIITGIFNLIGNIAKQLQIAWDTSGIGDAIWRGILWNVDNVLKTLHNIIDATAEWAGKLDFEPLLQSTSDVLRALEPLTANIGEGLEWFWSNVLLPIAGWTIQDAVPTFLDMVSEAISALNNTVNAFKPLGGWIWEKFLQPFGKWTGEILISAMESITDLFKKFSDWVRDNSNAIENFTIIVGSFVAAWTTVDLALKVAGIVSALATFVTTGGLATAIATGLGAAIGFLTSPITLATLAIGTIISVGVLLWKNWDTVIEKAKQLGSWISDIWDGITKVIGDAIENIKGWIDDLLGAFGKVKTEQAGMTTGGLGGALGGAFGKTAAGISTASFEVPALATGAVFRGGRPFLAIVNDQPSGQTNVETPLKVIKQALREELTSLIDKFNNLQLIIPAFEVGQFQPAPPPEFDFESRYQNSYQAAEAYWREEERQRRKSNYDGFDGELPSDIEKKLYEIIYSATRAANKNSQSSFDNEKTIRLQVDLDGDKLYDKIYKVNGRRYQNNFNCFVPEDFRGYHPPASWITSK